MSSANVLAMSKTRKARPERTDSAVLYVRMTREERALLVAAQERSGISNLSEWVKYTLKKASARA